MDVSEKEQIGLKVALEEIARPPLVPSEKSNAVLIRKKSAREIPSRYKAALAISPAVFSRQCLSPNFTPTSPSNSPLFSQRAQSTERGRLTASAPSSPTRFSTPVEVRRLSGGKTSSETLWPATMRSLCASLKSDNFSLGMKERSFRCTSPGPTLRSSAINIQQKQSPERKRTPVRARSFSDLLENLRPTDNSIDRRIGRTGKRVLKEKPNRVSSLQIPKRGISPLGKFTVHDSNASKNLRKSVSEIVGNVNFHESGKLEYELQTVSDAYKLVTSSVGVCSSPSDRNYSTLRASRSMSLPISSSPRPSPRGLTPSPSRNRPSTPVPLLMSSMTHRPSSSSSVLSFVPDVRKGKKGANDIEDAHQLRLLYNRCLQWHYATAQADAALSIQKVKAEKTLYNVWTATSELWDSVTMKRIDVEQLRQDLKLNLLLNGQMAYLEDWDLLEVKHSSSLNLAIESLEACTARLPLTEGAHADTQIVKNAVCSAVAVMQTIDSSIFSLQSMVRVAYFSPFYCWYQSDLVVSDPVAMAEGPNATDPVQVLAPHVGGPSVNPRPLNTQMLLDQLEEKMQAVSGIIDQVTTLEERLDGFSDDQVHMGERLVTLEGVVEGNMATLLDQVAELSSKSQSSSQSQQRTGSSNNYNKGKNGGYQARSGGDQGHGQNRSGGASTGGASSFNSGREYHRPRNNGGASSSSRFQGRPGNLKCFLCGGNHKAYQCPQKTTLNALMALHGDQADDTTQGNDN
ncbi:hypothetical protein GIB67_016833, partial [Kingdonia uniflora]